MERHTLKAAVYLILIKDGGVLLVRRFNTGWQDGNYSLPAGHIDPNETAVGAMIREAGEEIGLVLRSEDLKLVHVMHRVNNYIDFFFVALKWDGEPKNLERNKCDDVSWFPLDALPQNVIPSVREALSNYQRGIQFSESNTPAPGVSK